MALKRERKEELVADYTDLLRESKGVILTEYRGLTNQQITKLRRAIRDANGAYHVTKVTLLLGGQYESNARRVPGHGANLNDGTL